jgi:hypothetical protein
VVALEGLGRSHSWGFYGVFMGYLWAFMGFVGFVGFWLAFPAGHLRREFLSLKIRGSELKLRFKGIHPIT